ncbi:hypothetical protein [Mycolicibacterium tokaiense]|uniref:Uncharacterized protein n=1 Tax=Mycolicibacterium tokaiense TaxID=39695 RepID=A0A378TMD9_9MYCO|nr:hypothetical protein [Mycolicibacterium tokaiense]BBY84708.1 hypothetical protein MTOK_04900 [Mycolicibacterium tokaiense]STZ60786.1 Uncharacterised protein [Mycolicibacterium tokaiense]
MADVTFLSQNEPVDEYGRALYAVSRSILRAHFDELSQADLVDLNCDKPDVTFRQLAKLARLHRDKGLRGDGFEWAVHEAILGGEPRVTELVAEALRKVSPKGFADLDQPHSLMFGHERARHLGFTDAVVSNASGDAVLLPDGSGRPFAFGSWVPIAARGVAAEPDLATRIKKVWKTDIFLSGPDKSRFAATTIKSNWHHLEDGNGLRVAIVPQAVDLRPGYSRWNSLHLVALPDPDGFMGLFNDAYEAVAEAILTVGGHDRGLYFYKPSAKAQRIQKQLEKYGTVKVVEILEALNDAAQQNLIAVDRRLMSVEAPEWLHINEKRTPIIAPRPSFEKLD